MKSINYSETEFTKKVVIKNRLKPFILIFSVIIFLFVIVSFFSGIKIENETNIGISQEAMVGVVVLILLLINWALLPFEIEIKLQKDSNNFSVKRRNYFAITKRYSFDGIQNPTIIGELKNFTSMTGRRYRGFLKFTNNKEESIKLFPFIGIFFINSLYFNYVYNYTADELRQISNFLNVSIEI